MLSSIHRFRTRYLLCIAAYAILLVVSSCAGTRYVPDGEYLLKKNKVEVNSERVKGSDLGVYLKQQPNRSTFLTLKVPLAMYNLSTPEGTFFLNKWLRDKVGEPPVILDTTLIESSKDNLAEYMRSVGYYDFNITDTIIYKGKKKAEVRYSINVGNPIRIRSVAYQIEDPTIRELVLADSLSARLRRGAVLSTSLLEGERDRIATMLRNNGYYEFNKNYITFQADTTVAKSRADVVLKLSNVQKIGLNKDITYVEHTRFYVKDVYIYTNYEGAKAYRDSLYRFSFDTLNTDKAHFLYDGELKIRPAAINRINLININSLYSDYNVTRTYTNLSNLNLYRSVTIRFKEDDTEELGVLKPLICEILLHPSEPQGYKLGLEVSTNADGLLSLAPAVGYDHRNIFKGAELFQINVRGAYQRSVSANFDYSGAIELGISSSLTLPRFLAPFTLPFSRRSIPHTTFLISYGYQKRPDYTRQMGGGRFGYSWKTTDYLSFTYNPIEVNVVKMLDRDDAFYASLRDPYMKKLYEDHFVGGTSASLEYRSKLPGEQSRSSHFFRVNVDLAGNLISLFDPVLNKDTAGYHYFFGSPYAQYAKADFNYSFNRRLSRTTSIAYHAFFGIGKPYGNAVTLPLEKMFFAGGANSLRGWQARTVGPGSSLPDTTVIYSIPNQVGDLMLEGNIEYRFNVVSPIEGALFLDVGNIWSLNPNNSIPDAVFRFNRFYKEIAASVGIGARLNLGFLIVRLDVGFKLRDPSLSGSKLIMPNDWFRGRNNSWHFALNYPF